MKEKLRPLVMMAAVSFLLPLGEIIVLRRPLAPMDPVSIIDAFLMIFAIYWWYIIDRRERSFRTGTFQNIGVVALPPLALPIYFIRSRGWAKGLLVSFLALLVLIVCNALTLLGEEVGQRIAL